MSVFLSCCVNTVTYKLKTFSALQSILNANFQRNFKLENKSFEDNQDTLNILLPGSEIVSDAKERKSRGPNRFCESVGSGKMATKTGVMKTSRIT